ncbi:nucleotidyltransferase family protein [soil metagenome]
MPRKVVAAILAAGSSSRFGSPKQLANFGEKTLIDLALDAAIGTSAENICVILGCNFEQIYTHLANRKQGGEGRFHTLHNLNWKEGLSSSIYAATSFAKEVNATHLLMLVCDQPLVTWQLLESLLGLLDDRPVPNGTDGSNHSAPNAIVACKYENSVGIPAVFPAIYFNELMALKGDKGAKSIIMRSTAPILVNFPEGSADIDQPGDLSNLLRSD